MEYTTQPYTFVSHEPAKAWESFDQDRKQYRELLAGYHSHLKTAAGSFAVAVPASTIFSLGVYYHQANPDGAFTGSVGADLIVGAISLMLGWGGVSWGISNFFRAQNIEKKLFEQEQRMEVSARRLDDLII